MCFVVEFLAVVTEVKIAFWSIHPKDKPPPKHHDRLYASAYKRTWVQPNKEKSDDHSADFVAIILHFVHLLYFQTKSKMQDRR